MAWTEIAIAFFTCHLVGDFLLQTEWQAEHSSGALLAHLAAYTLAFVPALIWIGDHGGIPLAIAIGAVVYLPHLVIDDGRLRRRYMRAVKRTPDPPEHWLEVAVDQAMHMVCLFAAALLVGALA